VRDRRFRGVARREQPPSQREREERNDEQRDEISALRTARTFLRHAGAFFARGQLP